MGSVPLLFSGSDSGSAFVCVCVCGRWSSSSATHFAWTWPPTTRRIGAEDRMRHYTHARTIAAPINGNDSISGQIFTGFEFCGFEFGYDFSTTVFEFGPRNIEFGFGFGFSPADTQWITVWSKTSCFIVYLLMTLFT